MLLHYVLVIIACFCGLKESIVILFFFFFFGVGGGVVIVIYNYKICYFTFSGPVCCLFIYFFYAWFLQL